MLQALKLVPMMFLLGLGGCTGTLQTLLDRPITSDKLDDPGEFNKLKTVSGDRRLVRVAADLEHGPIRGATGQLYYKFDVCAETQADAITTRGGSSSFSAEGQASISDAATQSSTITNTRTTVSDVVRQLAWQLCSARMNDDLTPEQYAGALNDLLYNSMAVLQQTAMGANSKAVPLRGAPEIDPVPTAVPTAAPPATAPPAPAAPPPAVVTVTTVTKFGG